MWLKSSIGLNRGGGSGTPLAEGEVRPSFLGAATQFYELTVTTGAVSRAVDAIAAGTTVHSPTVAPGAVTVSPTVISGGTTIHNPTVAGGMDADAQAYFDAMTTAPDSTRKGLLNTLIAGLKTDGVWTKLDALYIMAAHDAQAARVNAKAPSSVASAVNSPSFTTDLGYISDGTSSYLDTNINPATAGGNYSQNSATIGVWSLTNVTDTLDFDIGNSSTNCRLNCRSALATTFRGQLNNSGGVNFGDSTSVPNSQGMFTITRTSSSNITGYRNAIDLGSSTVTSASVTSANMFLLNVGTDYSNRRLAAAFFGGALTGTDVSNLHSRLSTYLTAVGAI